MACARGERKPASVYPFPVAPNNKGKGGRGTRGAEGIQGARCRASLRRAGSRSEPAAARRLMGMNGRRCPQQAPPSRPVPLHPARRARPPYHREHPRALHPARRRPRRCKPLVRDPSSRRRPRPHRARRNGRQKEEASPFTSRRVLSASVIGLKERAFLLEEMAGVVS